MGASTESPFRGRRLAGLLLLVVAFAPGSPDLAAAQGFGGAVAADGAELFVGEPLKERGPAAVYVYRRGSDGAWSEADRITASDGEAEDRFGRALSAEGGTLWAGATARDSSTGVAYVFERAESEGWRQTGRFQPDDLTPGAAFGRAVAIDGSLALVAAPGAEEEKGAVFVYRREAGTWSRSARLAAGDLVAGDRFGLAVALRGDLALIGAPGQGDDTGAVYVFRRGEEAGGWTEAAKLQAGSLGENARFGSAVAVEDDRVVIGAPGHDGYSGAAFEFTRDEEAGSWEETSRLLAFDGRRGARFGTALAWSDGELWVGAPARGAGRLYRLRRSEDGEEWRAASGFVASGAERGDGFGATLAFGDRVAVAGLPGDDYGVGTALVLEPAEADRWATSEKVAGELESYAAVTGGAVECGGEAAHFRCERIDLISFLPVSEIGGSRGVRMNDIWGWTDPETGREYALAGRMDGTAFIDITDPENPRYLGSLPMTRGARANTWRDIKVYRDHAYIVADGAGEHGVQVFDLTRLRDVTDAPRTFDEDALYERVASVHNIVINPESGFAYAVGARGGGETCGGGLHMIDIREPTSPAFAGCFADSRTGRSGTGYTHDAQCVIYRGPDEEHRGREICVGANETALSVADVTDKENPVALAMATYPNAGYTHQGWFGPDQRYFYLDDELDELQGKVERTRTMVWDMADLDDPILVSEFMGPTDSSDHNLYVVGDRLLQSNYQSGLRILDVGDPENPEEIGWFDTVPHGENTAGFGGSWSNYPFFESGNIVVTSGREGFFVVRPRDAVAASPEALRRAAPTRSASPPESRRP